MIVFNDIEMRFGAKILFEKVSLQFQKGERYGLVGANGCGKTTLLKLIQNEISPEKGEIFIPKDLSVGTLSQQQELYDEQTLLDTVIQGKMDLWRALQKKALLEQQEHSQNVNELAECIEVVEKENGYSAQSEAAKILEGLGLLASRHQNLMSSLSGGYKLRVLIGRLLFSKPDIILLDEPTNHLDLPSIQWLSSYLKAIKSTVLVVSHDRHFLNDVCSHIADIDHGTIRFYSGNYDQFLEQKHARRFEIEQRLASQDRRKADLKEFVDRFRSKASKARQAMSKQKIIEKLEKEMEENAFLPSSRKAPHFYFKMEKNPPALSLKVQGLGKSFQSKIVFKNLNLEVERGEKIAIIGPNGIGKSTLLEILTGYLTQDQGTFNWGSQLNFSYFPQNPKRLGLFEGTLIEWLSSQLPEVPEQKLRTVCGMMLFSKEDVNKKVIQLSGGEMSRLVFAKLMLQQHHVLILDEPTNHLDIEAIESLIIALKRYPGTILFVSHNHYFVNQLAERIIHLEAEKLEEPAKKESANQIAFEETKKKRNQKKGLETKIQKIEQQITILEQQIQAIDEIVFDPIFYQEKSSEEQIKFFKEKEMLEKKLEEQLKLWEDKLLEQEKE